MNDLVEPSRFFVRSGLLQLCALDVSVFKKEVESLWFFLFNDLLVWAERKGDSYSFRGKLRLHGAKIRDASDNPIIQHLFHISSPEKTITVSATTKKEKKEWMDQITDLVAKLQEVRSHTHTHTHTFSLFLNIWLYLYFFCGLEWSDSVCAQIMNTRSAGSQVDTGPFVSVGITGTEIRKLKGEKPYTVRVASICFGVLSSVTHKEIHIHLYHFYTSISFSTLVLAGVHDRGEAQRRHHGHSRASLPYVSPFLFSALSVSFCISIYTCLYWLLSLFLSLPPD